MAGRRCPGRDERDGRTVACPTILTRGERYCGRHAREYEVRRGTTVQRGYGSAHRRERERIQALIDDGRDVRCWACDMRLVGSDWHLDHTEDRSDWRGPACIACNTRDGGRRGAVVRNAQT